MSAIASAFVSAVTRIASSAALPAEREQALGGMRRKTATIGRSRKSSTTPVAVTSAAVEPVYGAAFGIGRKPAFRSARCPRGPSSLLIHARAAGLFADLETTAIS